MTFEQPDKFEKSSAPYDEGVYDEALEPAHDPQSDRMPVATSPHPPREGRTLKMLVAIIGISAAFAGGFLTGSYFPLDDDESTTEPVDGTEADPRLTYVPNTPGDYGEGECAPAEGVAQPVLFFPEAPSLCIDPAESYVAVFDTTLGTVRVALNAANTPGTVNNFVNLARFGYYNGTLIHRSDPTIGILQGGSPHSNDALDPGPGYRIRDEGSGFTYRPGQLVMAGGDAPNSADAQYFFTVTEASAQIDGEGTFVVFGEVTEGLDVLTAILNAHQDEPGNELGGAPDPPVTVNTVSIETPTTTTQIADSGPAPLVLYLYPYTPGDYGEGECAPAEGVAQPVLFFPEAPSLCIDPAESYVAVFDTTLGTVRVALNAANTPGTVNNFVNLARFGYYNGTLIHRSDPTIGILQGGSPHSNDALDPGPGYRIWDEGSGFTYRPGQLVMVRGDAPNSADAQYFFTVTEASAQIDGEGTFVVFGEVTEGLDVLIAILNAHQDEPGNELGGAPDPPVTVNTVSIETPTTTTQPNGTTAEAGNGGQPSGDGAP